MVWALAAHNGSRDTPSRGPQTSWQEKANVGWPDGKVSWFCHVPALGHKPLLGNQRQMEPSSHTHGTDRSTEPESRVG